MSTYEDRAGSPPRPTSDGYAGRLFGRDTELKVLERFVTRAATDGGALLLYGEAGVGKTAMLHVAERDALLNGVRVISTVGVEFEAEQSYAGLLRVLGPALPSMPDLDPAHRRTLSTALGLDDGPPPERLAVSTAAMSLLALGRGGTPLLIIVDDLPWIDRASAVVLGFIARRLTGTGICFLGAFRTGEASYFDGGGLDNLEVTPLDHTSAAGLLDLRYPRLASRARQELLEQAAGNPLALLELPAEAQHQRPAGVNAPHAVTPMTDRLRGLFAARVKTLPESTRHVLLLAALDGTGEWPILAAASGLDEPLDELTSAENVHLVRVDREFRRVTFRHPLTRSAVVAMATPEERRGAHTLLAARLAAQPDRQAWHLAEAATGPDERVADRLEQTAERVQRKGDAVGAVAALLRAAELTPHQRDRSRRLALAAYVGAEITGDISQVPELLATAQENSSDGGIPLVVAVAASAYLLHVEGDVDAAHRVLVGAIENRDTHGVGDQTLVEALWYLIAICAFSGRPEPWNAWNTAVMKLRPAPPRYLTMIAKTFGNPAYEALTVLAQLDEMLGRLSQESDPAQVARLGIASAYVDRLVACRGPLQRVLDHGRDGGAITSQLQVAVLVGEDHYFGGQWDEVLENCAEAVRVGQSHSYPLLTWTMMHQRALVDAARGNTKLAREVIEGMIGWAAPRGVDLLVHYAHGIESLLALGQEDHQKAWEHACRITAPGEIAPYVPYVLWNLLDFIEAGARSGHTADVVRHVATLRRMRIPDISPRLAMITAAAEGMTAEADSFTGAFDAALAVPEATRWPFELARIQLYYGERLRHTRKIVEARRHLNPALDAFQRLDAQPWAVRARNELRATGRPPTKRPAKDLTTLTPQQREIALLAAAGLTNKQIAERLFLSPRTVGTHLYQIFPKLGVVSRAGLRDALNDRTP